MYYGCRCGVGGDRHASHNAKLHFGLWVCNECQGTRYKETEALEEALEIQRASAILELYQSFQGVDGKAPHFRANPNKVKVGPDLGPAGWKCQLSEYM
jgi:hypothetical protein